MVDRMTRADWVIVGLIAVLALFHLVLISGVIHGERALAAPPNIDPSQLPAGNAPTILSPADMAERDDSAELPGTFVRSQGRMHVRGQWPLDSDDRVPYCREDQVSNFCYTSNPPTSGLHLGVQHGARMDTGDEVRLPPPPGVYRFDMPREVVPHIQEHAGVFVGYRCESAACEALVEELRAVVQEEIEAGAIVVMAPFSDLEADTMALAAWTRIDSFAAGDFDAARVRAFIEAHSCRFDPEGFCR